jgi:hypothetical protein
VDVVGPVGLRVVLSRSGTVMAREGKDRGMGGEGARRSIASCRRGRHSCEMGVGSKSRSRFVHSMANFQHLSFRHRQASRVNTANWTCCGEPRGNLDSRM